MHGSETFMGVSRLMKRAWGARVCWDERVCLTCMGGISVGKMSRALAIKGLSVLTPMRVTFLGM